MTASALSRPRTLPPGLLIRLIDRDESWLRTSSRAELRGVVLTTRSLANSRGQNLLDVVVGLGIPHLMDPDTAVLVEVTRGHQRAEWLLAMPAGALIKQPPVKPEDLDAAEDVELFNRVVMSTQRAAAALSAGYFRIISPDDPWRTVNSRLLDKARSTAAGRPLCGWLEVTADALVAGVVGQVAIDYTSADFVVLRVAGLSGASASDDHVDALLAAVSRLRRAGPRVIVDGLGTLGTTCLPVGAYAVSAGADHHRSVPIVRVHKRPPKGRPLGYEVALQWRQPTLEDARAEAKAGTIGPCFDSGCDVLAHVPGKGERTRLLRRHYFHAAQADADFAGAASPLEVAAEMLTSPDAAAQRWGRALQRWADAASSSIHSAR